MFNLLLGPLTDIIGTSVKGYVETRKIKGEQKLTKIKAETELLNKKIQGEIDWDVEAVKGKNNSWADEWLTVLFSVPLILAFIPQTADIVLRGFEVLEAMPNYYKAFVGSMVAAAFGIRSVSKIMKK